VNDATKVVLERAGFVIDDCDDESGVVSYKRTTRPGLTERVRWYSDPEFGDRARVALNVPLNAIPRVLAVLATPTPTEAMVPEGDWSLSWQDEHDLRVRFEERCKALEARVATRDTTPPPIAAPVALTEEERETICLSVDELETYALECVSGDAATKDRLNGLAQGLRDMEHRLSGTKDAPQDTFTEAQLAMVREAFLAEMQEYPLEHRIRFGLLLTDALNRLRKEATPEHPIMAQIRDVMASYDADEVAEGLRNFLAQITNQDISSPTEVKP
jgi:hypothetical protein